jgi:DNA-binding response OmpR family regulator
MQTQQAQVADPRPWANPHDKSFGILVVGGFDSDLIALLEILNDTDWTLYWNTTSEDAAETLRRRRIGVVLCDRDLPSGDWKDVLATTESLASPPPLIVTARFANERLWAEVLSLNGYDVLTKPFDTDEVIRALSLAAQAWRASDSGRGGASAA